MKGYSHRTPLRVKWRPKVIIDYGVICSKRKGYGVIDNERLLWMNAKWERYYRDQSRWWATLWHAREEI